MVNQDSRRPQLGMEVIDILGRFIGTVESLEHDHFVVQQGFFFPKSQRIPNTAIDQINGHELTLRISREDAMHSSEDTNWSDRPEHGEVLPQSGEIENSTPRDDADPHKT